MSAMRAVMFLMLAAGVATAAPKSVPAKFAKAAGDAFAKAQAADAKGDLDEAARQYQRAIQIAPHPNAYYNLADVLRRDHRIDPAIAAYTKYLELSPDAPDRSAIEKLVRELAAMPSTLEIEMDEPDGVAFVDGKLAGPMPATMTGLAKGTYQVDVVTPITFDDMACAVSAGSKRTCTLHAKPRVDGNVVISGSWLATGRSWPIGDQRFHFHGRFTARPGHYELKGFSDDQCAPLPLDVPEGEDIVTYAYVTFPPSHARGHACTDLKITQQRVKFPPTK